MITKEIIEKYGLTPEAEHLKEDGSIDIDTFAALFQAKQRELALQDKELIEPVRQQAKKEGEIIATKRALKALKTKFGIDLSNSDLEAKTIEELADIALNTLTSKSTDEIKDIQARLIEEAKKAQELEESFSAKIQEIEKSYKYKYASKELEKQVLSLLSNEKMIIPNDKALKLFLTELKDNGYYIQIDEAGNLSITKDEEGKYPVLKDDNTGTANVAYLFNKFLADFKVKNNGSGQGGQGTPKVGDSTYKPSEKMQELMKAFGKR